MCSFCGALLTNADLADASRAVSASVPEPAFGQPAGPVLGEEWEGAAAAEEKEEPPSPFPGRPRSAPAQPPPAAGTKISSFWRVLTVLLFFLIPLFNYFLRNARFGSEPGETPVVERLVFCEDIRDGRPVNPKAVFSLEKDARVVAYGIWRGARGQHAYSLRWYTPAGRLFPGSATVTRYPPGENEFFTYGILSLRPDLPPGKWQVEVLMDRRVQRRSSFELGE